jgi:hypothetical protein
MTPAVQLFRVRLGVRLGDRVWHPLRSRLVGRLRDRLGDRLWRTP